MSRKAGLRLTDLLWGVAALGFGLGAITLPATTESLLSLAVAGHLLVFWLMLAAKKSSRSERFQWFVPAILGAYAAFEMIAAFVFGAGETPQRAAWFQVGMSYAVLAGILAWRSPPTDGVFMSQTLFHSVLTVPILPVVIGTTLSRLSLPGSGIRFGIDHPLTRQSFELTSVLLPIVFTVHLAVLAHLFVRDDSEPSLSWATVLANQAAFLILAFRWSTGGI